MNFWFKKIELGLITSKTLAPLPSKSCPNNITNQTQKKKTKYESKQPQIISPQNLIKTHKNKFENLTPTAHTSPLISQFYLEKLTKKKKRKKKQNQ